MAQGVGCGCKATHTQHTCGASTRKEHRCLLAAHVGGAPVSVIVRDVVLRGISDVRLGHCATTASTARERAADMQGEWGKHRGTPEEDLLGDPRWR